MGSTDKVFANDMLEREVLDLGTGSILGSIVDYVITKDGTVSLIGILGERWFEGGSGIPPSSVTNINQERVTIGDAAGITDFDPDGEESYSVNTDTFIWGKNVLEESGELLGDLQDFCFTLADGVISDLVVLDAASKRHKVAIDKILTIGRDYIIVTRGTQTLEELPAEPAAAEEPATADPADSIEVGIPAAKPKEAVEPEPSEPTRSEEKQALFGGDKPKTTLSKFDQEKRDYLAGKNAPRELSDADGNVIAEAGAALDGEALDRIVDAGMLGEVFIEMTAKS